MLLPPLSGHTALRRRFADAVQANRLPQVILLTGESGIGKQRLALWLGQLLLCTERGPEPCGNCSPCRRALALRHPDLHWFIPVPSPKGGDSDKQVDEVAESLETILAERREAGRWGLVDGMQSHGIASARLIQQRASLTPVEGGWRIFIIGNAERLVPQESSDQAANALLKLLEEPPTRTLFVLTTVEAGQILTTIRSRAVPIRVARLTDEEVAAWANAEGLSPDPSELRAAAGSIGRFQSGVDPAHAKANAAAQAVLQSLDDGPEARTILALKQGVSQARGEFTTMLDALALALEDTARQGAMRGEWSEANLASLRIGRVLEAREQAQGNVSPQLALASLLDDLSALQVATC